MPIGVNTPNNNPSTVRITKPAEGENPSGMTSIKMNLPYLLVIVKIRIPHYQMLQ